MNRIQPFISAQAEVQSEAEAKKKPRMVTVGFRRGGYQVFLSEIRPEHGKGDE